MAESHPTGHMTANELEAGTYLEKYGTEKPAVQEDSKMVHTQPEIHPTGHMTANELETGTYLEKPSMEKSTAGEEPKMVHMLAEQEVIREQKDHSFSAGESEERNADGDGNSSTKWRYWKQRFHLRLVLIVFIWMLCTT